jgi:hypothetical protein
MENNCTTPRRTILGQMSVIHGMMDERAARFESSEILEGKEQNE